MPLKFSKVFDEIFKQNKSIGQIAQSSGLEKYHYAEVVDQFEILYKLIDSQYGR